MAGYYGSAAQQHLQAQSEMAVDFIRATPGACQNCRMIGCDQPEQLGWKRIFEFLDRDGMCGFRLLSPEHADDVRSRLGERDFRLDTWDVFLAGQAEALAASEAIVAYGLPDGFAVLDPPTDPVGADTKRLQSLIGDAGIVPFSGSFLVGHAARLSRWLLAIPRAIPSPRLMATCRITPTVPLYGMPGAGSSLWQNPRAATVSANM